MGAILQPAVLTMSSREIADLVESRHDNVKVTIERLVARGVIESPALQEMARPRHTSHAAMSRQRRPSISRCRPRTTRTPRTAARSSRSCTPIRARRRGRVWPTRRCASAAEFRRG